MSYPTTGFKHRRVVCRFGIKDKDGRIDVWERPGKYVWHVENGRIFYHRDGCMNIIAAPLPDGITAEQVIEALENTNQQYVRLTSSVTGEMVDYWWSDLCDEQGISAHGWVPVQQTEKVMS